MFHANEGVNPDGISMEDMEKAYANMISILQWGYPAMSESLKACIRSRARIISFNAGEVILDYGEICDHCLFTLTGTVRSSFIIDGREIPVWFSTPGNVVIAVDSWYTQQPSKEKLTAFKDGLCAAISHADFQDILNTYVEFNTAVRRLTELYLQKSLERTLWIYFDSYQKYKHTIQHHWNIAKELPISELAKFLGVARETLSRLRNRKWTFL